MKFGFSVKMDIKNIIMESCILLFISAAVAFTVNAISPNGIALIGQWDTSKGVISAKANNNLIKHELEIDSVLDAKKFFDSGEAVFIDARSIEEYKEGHIKGAESLPIMNFDEVIEDVIEKYTPATFIITYCSGRECEDSHELAQLLFDVGFQNVSVYIDGFPTWAEHGYPVE
jgi:rhodanese-related sulfurtransferase